MLKLCWEFCGTSLSIWWDTLLLRYKAFMGSSTGRFFGEDKSMCYGRGDPIERRMGLKWRVASLPDNGQRFSFPAFGTQSRVDIHTHARTRVCAYVHLLTYVYFIGNSLSRPNSLSHVRSPHRSVSQVPLTSFFLEIHSYSAQNEPWGGSHSPEERTRFLTSIRARRILSNLNISYHEL